MNVRRFSIYLILFAATVLCATQAIAQTSGWLSYAAKFVCNAETSDDAVMQGKYRTMVNIHNPHYLFNAAGGTEVTFFKKVARAKPQGEQRFPPSCQQIELLPADHALGVDCDNIKTLLSVSGLPSSGDLEGFVVIEVPPQGPAGAAQVAPPLDVVSVITARPRTGIDADVRRYDVRDVEVNRVPAIEILGDPVQNLCPPD